ncbi:class I SAM-dependent methyltransferase [Candidatus Kuenenia stuttgartensis]|uniref:Methyltransferase type 11 domain-containing protein n=1 Tax=Kuenenia stuttgartiensis TaxID=174633 RepID=Q1Q6Z3_KUEST|nr:class I SAM-dependent methyltransferase [Candidatus Kuenenia stuttgartiensis]CAJ73347.1 hypothetical protein kuste2599 [Candidatus Kuenenia stuttgartiensis]
MNYLVTKEHKYPNLSSLKLVENIAKLISHDVLELPEWFHDYASAHCHRIAFDLDLVKKHVPVKDAKVLELGSVPLLLTGALRELGYDIQGIDIAPERFQSVISRVNVNVRKCDIEVERLPFPDSSFDAILFFELFEHLRINPIFTMKENFRVLKPGGVLLVSTPNLKSLDGIINFLFQGKAFSLCGDIYKEYEKLQSIGHMGHVREFTVREVSDFLTKIGFRVNEIIYRGWYFSGLKQLAIRLFPKLRPYITIVATK